MKEASQRSWDDDDGTRRKAVSNNIRKAIAANTGKKLSEERKQQIRETRLGKPQTAKQKLAAKNASAHWWLVESPERERIEVFSLHAFAKERGFSSGNLQTYGHTKGWKLIGKIEKGGC